MMEYEFVRKRNIINPAHIVSLFEALYRSVIDRRL